VVRLGFPCGGKRCGRAVHPYDRGFPDSRNREQTESMLAGTLERARLEPRTEYYLAVVLPEDETLVGFARLGFAGVRAAKLG